MECSLGVYMSGEAVLLCGTLLIAVLFLLFNRHQRTSDEPPFVFSPSLPEPDLKFAAKGYQQVAISRRYAPHIDLHQLEQSYAAVLFKEGCSREQALSARWGGTYAIVDPLSNFDDAIAAYKETADEQGIPYKGTKEGAARMYDAAALLVVTTAHVADPHEYRHFLRYIKAHI